MSPLATITIPKMAYFLTRNGQPLCALIPSAVHAFPPQPKECWQDCTIVTGERVLFPAGDVFAIQIPDWSLIPFRFSRSRFGVEGWEHEGQVLF